MAPSFCRHNRFIQRCPICRETVPGYEESHGPAKSRRESGRTASSGGAAQGIAGASGGGGARAAKRSGRSPHARSSAHALRVRREQRFLDDGYRCELAPGLRSSEDARRFAEEVGFAAARLAALAAEPPSLYAQARDEDDLEQAVWICFLAAYLSPSQDENSFEGIRRALACDWRSGELPDLVDVPLGPRSSHDQARGVQTLQAYRRFAEHAGSQQRAFAGEPEWSPQRRFERVFERLALPGFGRVGRFDLLLTLGGLGLFDLEADSLHLATRTPGSVHPDPTPEAAKRMFGIGDQLLLERRALTLADALQIPIGTLDLALWNWAAGPGGERATIGFDARCGDEPTVQRTLAALGL